MKKILFLVQLPPPIHGGSMVNQQIYDSITLNNRFCIKYIDISPAKELSDVGKINLCKLIKTFAIFFNSIIGFLKVKPDLVYITLSPHGAAFYKDGIIALFLKFLGAKLVFHMHGKGVKLVVEKSKFKKIIYRTVFKNVDIIHLSNKLFFDLEIVRDLSKKIFAVPNGVKPLKHLNKINNEKLTFIYLSNLVRLKGADILIRATSLMPKEYRNLFNVKIVGKQSCEQYYNELIEIIKSNNITNVEFCGPKYGKDKELALTSSDVFVLPTQNDCFPLSILEAMSAGLPVISTNEGAITDMVDSGLNGEIINNCTPEELASVMIKFINNRDYTRNCGMQAYKKFEHLYTNIKFEQNMANVLELIIENNKVSI